MNPASVLISDRVATNITTRYTFDTGDFASIWAFEEASAAAKFIYHHPLQSLERGASAPIFCFAWTRPVCNMGST